ncbi:hypothetical protein FA95DRAFT_1650432 [Auriscalpium vulgare]|uniref:Uncharacterized protein n=1 Tax=Auriscalpium vulgare TaxID=40419 RepID=A0ACB8RZC9_9AGAM|nr:hypothetical protein FA95DRAFT_1650432 [Auriscalpium vulgare]
MAPPDPSQYLRVPTDDEARQCMQNFFNATSSASLRLVTCSVCARTQTIDNAGAQYLPFHAIPNSHRLHPHTPHPAHELHLGCLLLDGTTSDLGAPERPSDKSTLQSGLRGNVTTFEMNTTKVANMVDGALMPQRPIILASLVTIAYIGSGSLPKEWLRSAFKVRRRHVADALLWLKTNNPKYYGDISIDADRLGLLPEDDVPLEILETIRQEQDEVIGDAEGASYVPVGDNDDTLLTGLLVNVLCSDLHADAMYSSDAADDLGPDVIPLHFAGVHDTDLSQVSSRDLLMSGLANLQDNFAEQPYHIRHSTRPVPDLPGAREDAGLGDRNMWEEAYPVLYPYGVGGMEKERQQSLTLQEHVQWSLMYHDRRFRTHSTFAFLAFGILQRRQALQSARIQMKKRDFDSVAVALSTISLRDLELAAKEEENHAVVSNGAVRLLKRSLHATSSHVMGSDAARMQYRSMIWSTSIAKNPPSVWITVNPDDLHDPIAQVLCGLDIDLDAFDATLGPSKRRRAQNIAEDPFAAAQFFHFLVTTIIRTLFGITVSSRGHVETTVGVFGEVSAYFGTVEAQGRGTLHLHMLIWLKNTPSPDEMKDLLKTEAFRAQVREYIRANFRAHMPGLDSLADVRATATDAEVAYSRPPNPQSPQYAQELVELERRVVRTKQVHTCTLAQCLRINKVGQAVCKRRAPWPLSDDAVVDENGNWQPKRSYGYLNSWSPLLTAALRCNTDSKLLTNAGDALNITFYVTSYAAKKQGRYHNASGLLAKHLAYHFESNTYQDDIRDRQRLLLFRSVNVLNREQEIPAPLVISYLMGWGDVYRSHHYTPVYWSSFAAHLLRECPELKRSEPGQAAATQRSVFLCPQCTMSIEC